MAVHDITNVLIGCLIGQATGDALGFIIEGHGAEVAKAYVEQIIKPVVVPAMVRLPQFTFGQYSDDTQLARECLISIKQCHGVINPPVFATRIAMLFMPNAYRIVGYGAQTAKAAEAIRRGTHHTQSGAGNSLGNGSAMRSAPLGVLLHDDTMVRTLAAITHGSTRCCDASVAIARAARYAMETRQQAFKPMECIAYIKAGGTIHPDYAHDLTQLGNILSSNMGAHMAAKTIIGIGLATGEADWHGCISCGVTQSSLWAIWSVCRSPDSYVDCIANAIIPGGDVDTTAAMAGGIIGCRLGIGGIPPQWRDQLHDINEWNCQELIELCCDVGKLQLTTT